MSEYKPKPKARACCIICGELIGSEPYHGGRVKRGGLRFAHKACWDAEQAENARRSKP